MKLQLRPIGQRLAIVLPDALLEQLGIDEHTALDLDLTEDGRGIVVRRATSEAPAPDSTERFNMVKSRLSPAAKRLLKQLESSPGTFLADHEVRTGKRMRIASDSDVLVACGRLALHDPRVLMIRGRIGVVPEGTDPADFEPDWSFVHPHVDRSRRGSTKDQIVLRHLMEHRGELIPREEVYAHLHRRWKGEGGIMIRDVDMCAASLAFSRADVVVCGCCVGVR